MKVNVQVRKATFGKGYDLYLNGEYEGYFETVEDAKYAGESRARIRLGLTSKVVLEFEVGDDDEV